MTIAQVIDPKVVNQATTDFEKFLTIDELAEVVQSWGKAKVKQRRRPKWYSLYDGPPNIEQLANHLDLRIWYEILYRYWSNDVHAQVDAITSGIKTPCGTRAIRPIRHPDGLNNNVIMAISITSQVYQKIIDADFNGRLDEYCEWYAKKIAPKFSLISNNKIVVNFGEKKK